jgi:DNA-binding NtrC family response regulator
MPQQLNKENPFQKIITRNTEMLSIFQYIESVVKTREPILITGERGVGKALTAKAIHAASGVSGPFIQINLNDYDEAEISDILFGRLENNDNADSLHSGMIEKAKDGTLFFNEINLLSSSSQIKMLRLLQYGEYLPTGWKTPNFSNAYVITSTSSDLWNLQRSFKFRKDLNLKIRSHHVHIPPLKERPDDIPILIDFFLERAAAAFNKKKPTPPKELITLLKTYSFPYNVSELKHIIFKAVENHRAKVLSLDTIKSHIDQYHPADPSADAYENANSVSPFKNFESLPTIKQAAYMLIEEAMQRSGGNQSIAARMLGISQPALSKRIKNGPFDAE